MSDFPMVSVVMSAYNAEKYIAESIESILSQTYDNFEFIIIDDGSNDTTFDIIKKYLLIDERVILISRSNKGLVVSLNEGILKAKGKYILRMDADDISFPDRITKQVSYMEENPLIGVCGTWIESFGDGKKVSKHKYSSSDEYLKARLLFSTCFAHPSVIIRRSLLIDNNFFYDEGYLYAEDFELWTRLSNVTNFSNVDEVLLRYRVLNNSVTRIADRDYTQRYQVLSSVFDNFLASLNINNNDHENNMHFILSVNTRIRDNNLSFKDLERYFNKLIQANVESNKFDQLALKRNLGKKWIWNLFYRKEMKAIFSKYFFYGILDVICKK